MAHDRVAFLRWARFENKSYTYLLGPGSAQAELTGEVAAEGASDEE